MTTPSPSALAKAREALKHHSAFLHDATVQRVATAIKEAETRGFETAKKAAIERVTHWFFGSNKSARDCATDIANLKRTEDK